MSGRPAVQGSCGLIVLHAAQVAFTMGQHGMAIDPRHTMLLADNMTYKVGHLTRPHLCTD